MVCILDVSQSMGETAEDGGSFLKTATEALDLFVQQKVAAFQCVVSQAIDFVGRLRAKPDPELPEGRSGPGSHGI